MGSPRVGHDLSERTKEPAHLSAPLPWPHPQADPHPKSNGTWNLTTGPLGVEQASVHPLSLPPEPCAPMMEPQESSIRYSRWENSHPDEVHVASGPSTEEASGWQR